MGAERLGGPNGRKPVSLSLGELSKQGRVPGALAQELSSEPLGFAKLLLEPANLVSPLDELLRTIPKARPQFIGIEHLSDKQLEEIRAALEKEAGGHTDGKSKTPSASVEKLLKRY